MIDMPKPAVAALALVLSLAPGQLRAQADSMVVVTAGREYAAGHAKSLLLGDEYRDLWTLPIHVPVLDLENFAGGLHVSHLGGGHQTKVLHLRNREGREFVFRSVNKYPDLLDEPALQETPVADIVKDQVSSLHPAGAAVVPPLLDAIGIVAPEPVLVVMPDDPVLGDFREEFAGLLGWLEERPNEIEVEGSDEVRPGFAGYTRIISTERLLERLEESPQDRIDARSFLAARLVDLLIGDWDRHYDQWRWAQVDRDGVTYWIPIPRDRDYAFVHYDGLVLSAARRAIRNVVRFGPEIADVSGLTLNARDLDRRLLSELGVSAWDSAAALVQTSLTDSVIATAVAQMPPEYVHEQGAELEAILRGRRNDLGNAARRFYAGLADAVDVRGTDVDDFAVIERRADRVVEVRLFERTEEDDPGARAGLAPDRGPRGEPYYRRVFYAPETREVRIFLHGGDDRAIVRGRVGESLIVRVIGGGGDDMMVDSSIVLSGRLRTAFYDERGENSFTTSRRTRVDTRAYEPPGIRWEVSGERYRDWGYSRSVIPVVDYRNTDGLIVGGGSVHTRYGFRQWPYASRIGATARLGLSTFNPALEVFGDFRRSNSPYGWGFRFDASELESFRFFGFGNDSRPEAPDAAYRVDQGTVALRVYLDRRSPNGTRLAGGPAIAYTNPDVRDDSPLGELPRYGNAGFGQLGGWLEAEIDRREDRAFPRAGFRLESGAEAFPGVWTATGPFGSVSATAASYLTPLSRFPVTLAVRAGGERVWGEFPVHEASFLGGSGNLRGYPFQRFAGDALAFGNAELRAPLTSAVLVVRGTLGALALADAGRVWYDGASEGGWHTAAGGGLWFEFDIRESSYAATALYAAGSDGGRFYLSLGAPF